MPDETNNAKDAVPNKDGSRKWRGGTDDMVADALVKSAGVISLAAKQVGLDRHAVARRISKSAKLRRVQQEVIENVLDMAEGWLMKHIKDGHPYMLKFYLSTKGKGRGYTSKMEIGVAPDITPPRIIDDITDAEVVCKALDSQA
jgi:hypothetical protein